VAALRRDTRDASARELHGFDAAKSVDVDAERSRAFGVAPHERPRKYHGVVGVEARRHDAARLELRHDVSRSLGVDQARVEAELALKLDALRELGGSLFVARQEQVAALPEPGVDAVLVREFLAVLEALAHEAHVGFARPLRAHAAAVATARAAAQVTRVEHQDAALRVLLGEVIRRGQPHDAGADDHDIGGIR
jgi:hypothetical protein